LAIARFPSPLIVTNGKSCSVVIAGTNIQAFHMLLPIDQLKLVADDRSILSVHVCECLLTPGDSRTCALATITKSALPIKLDDAQLRQLGGRIFIRIEDPSKFSELYSALNVNYSPPNYALAWQLLQSGAGVVPPPPPTISPPPPSPPDRNLPLSERKDKESKHHCELESSVCINSKGDPSAEFELKCEGLPPIIVSTDGKAGLKVGPLEVSISAGGSK
jgi:hypothetical protein